MKPNAYKHGASGKNDSLYNLWKSIRQRCNNPTNADYPHYGGRGIKICKRWDDFTKFAADVGPHPGKVLTLDRRNNNKNYTLGNVRWATRAQQTQNRGCVKLTKKLVSRIRAEYKTKRVTQQQLSDKYGVNQMQISAIVLHRSWK